MVLGNLTSAPESSRQENLRVPRDGDVSNSAHLGHRDITLRVLSDGNANLHHIRKEIQPDADLTMSVITRMTTYVRQRYPSWSADLTRISLGVVLMSATREVTVQDLVHFLRLAQGGAYLRSHCGQAFLYENGRSAYSTALCPSRLFGDAGSILRM